MSAHSRRFIDSIKTPPGYDLAPCQEAAIEEAFNRFLREDLVAQMILKKAKPQTKESPMKMLLPHDWTDDDEQVADFRAKWNGQPGHSIAEIERGSFMMCSDCPPEGYPTDTTRCAPCPRRYS